MFDTDLFVAKLPYLKTGRLGPQTRRVQRPFCVNSREPYLKTGPPKVL